MPQRRTLACSLAAAALLATGIAACSDALAPYPQFTIQPRTMSVKAGATSNVAITLAGPNKDASWTVTSGNTGVANATQTAAGATIQGVAAGSTKVYVRASAKGFPGDAALDSLTVNVTP